ncbi:M56 family metallopeptidase [Chitinophaga agrisoli]|uniref:M56 family metallopeptidase n=1 Tax=Chitinophaga agrisoli TaxID=2607653 RepID=A0A5B2VKI4_9BACT|nr:M56 family metallopeptidase [Chitinophaga agrisoli]KAA2240113.1 M56 family metallopeptidase [Chitinophaga agrisoli]
MVPLISYLLKMLVCSGILYAYYHVALRNNRFHQWNRYYLLAATLLSLVLPLLQLPVPAGRQAPLVLSTYTTQIITLREFILPAPGAIDYLQMALYGYGLVVLLLLSRTLYGCWKIRRLIQRNPVEQRFPYRLVQSEEVKTPFSFFRYIFWNRDISPDSADGRQILQHELTHVTEKHSVDKLLMELVCAAGWINPFFHLSKKELTIVHEFIADQHAAAGKVADYAQTILQVTLQSRQLQLTNSFFHPPIKRRINMLFAHPSNFTIMKKLIAIPVLIALIIFVGCQRQQQDAQPGVIDITMEQMKTIDAENIKEINISNNEALLRTKDGRTYRVKDYPFEDLKRQSAKHDNVPKEVFTFVDNPPTFAGGEEALAKYLGSHIKYPTTAQENNVSGTIFVQFVVNADGSISDVKTVGKTKGSGLEEESIRVVKEMPNWTPGEHHGKKVAVQFNLPIRYTLQDDATSMLQPFMLFKKKTNENC